MKNYKQTATGLNEAIQSNNNDRDNLKKGPKNWEDKYCVKVKDEKSNEYVINYFF